MLMFYNLQYERGNMKIFNMHLSGLQQMLNLRGGLAMVRQSSPMIANMIFWYVSSPPSHQNHPSHHPTPPHS